MKKDYKNSLSLSEHISRYPLAFTAFACLCCVFFTQQHQVNRYELKGVSGAIKPIPAVFALMLSALVFVVLLNLIRTGEKSKAKSALYVSGAAGALFLCWRGLLSANDTVFNASMLLIALAFTAICPYLYVKHRVAATVLAISSVLALSLYMGFTTLLFAFAVLIYACYILADDELELIKRIIATAALLLTAILVPVVYSTADAEVGGVLISGVILCLGASLVAELRGKSKIPTAILLMFGLGLLTRLGYVLDVNLPDNQHDVFSVFNTTHPRHNSYIMYIYENWSLPTEKVYNAGLSQYYHPPLYHFLAAVWIKVQTLMGIELYSAYENIQYFTMFCSAAMMTAGYKLFLEFKLKGVALYTAFAILAFHPTFFIFAGSVNNDPLTTALLFMAVLYTVRWYKEQSFKNTLMLAISIGFAMMSKLSGAMIAFGTAYVMLARLFDKNTGGFIENLKRLWSRFLAFGAVCFPLGLWWPIRCAIKYDMPLGYVPALSNNSVLYVGDYSIFQRLTGAGSLYFSNMYPNVGNTTVDGSAISEGAKRFYDYGIAPYIVKSSLFGEYFYKTITSPTQNVLAYIMVFSALLLIGISLYAMVKGLIKTKDELKVPVRFLLVYYVALMGSYVMFCFSYPHTCTMDFRYIVPSLLIGAVFSGMLINEEGKRFTKILLTVGTVLFSLSSVAFYMISY